MKVNLKAPESVRARSALKMDVQLIQLMKADYLDVEPWVDNNVTTLADARAVFKRILKVLIFVLRELQFDIDKPETERIDLTKSSNLVR